MASQPPWSSLPEPWWPRQRRCSLLPRAHVQTHSARGNRVNVPKIHLLDWPGSARDHLNTRASICRAGGWFPRDSQWRAEGRRDRPPASRRERGEPSQPLPRLRRVLALLVSHVCTVRYENLGARSSELRLHLAQTLPGSSPQAGTSTAPERLPGREWAPDPHFTGISWDPRSGVFIFTLRSTGTSLQPETCFTEPGRGHC